MALGMLVPSVQAQPIPATLAAFPVTIDVNAAKSIGDWKPIYRFFGADEPNYATMKDGKKLIGELGALRPNEVYFRAHNLLTSGNGTPAYKWGSTNAYTEDAQGRPVYNWTILDQIFDTYHAAGIKPYVEIGFMPEALSTHPTPYQHHWKPGDPASDIVTGWAYPPKDYNKWGELVYQWAKHCVDRYGMAEVEQWYWEVWNEANTGAQSGLGYLCAPAPDYHKLYDYSIAAVRRAVPKAKVGGAEAAGDGGQWSRDFIEHCLTGTNYVSGQIGTPIDFFSFHAKGSTPTIVDGHVRMGLGGQLRTIKNGFTIAASYPQTKPLPIVIGESDPDGCAACIGPNLAYRPGALFASYTAACIPREFELADRLGVNLEGALTWSFEFENEPYFKGQRVLATNGVDLPILNLFRMYGKMDGKRVAVTSTNAIALDDIMKSGVRGAPDVSALSTLGKDKLCVMVWHYHDDDMPGPEANVTLNLTGLPAHLTSARLSQYRIDENHSNAFTAWKQMGSPQNPTPEQYAQLEQAGQLQQMDGPALAPIADGNTTLQVILPRQAVAFFVLNWAAPGN